jgi:site-specific recombinase XerD
MGSQKNKCIWTDDLAEAFCSHLTVNKGRSGLTFQQYNRTAREFFIWAAESGQPLTAESVRAWLRHLYFEQGCMENSTRAGKLSGLRTVCTWLVATGALPANPTDGVDSPVFRQHAARKLDTVTLIRLLNAEQGKTTTSIRNRALLLLLYATGMRRAEICGLTLERLTLGQTTGRVHIIGKGAKERTVGFKGAPVEALNRWIIERCRVAAPGEQAVFVGISGRAPGTELGFNGARQVLKRAARLAGIKQDRVHLHLLRSTFATDLYDSGVPVKEIALLLGHSDESITWRRYIAISEKHLKKAVISANRWRELGVG